MSQGSRNKWDLSWIQQSRQGKTTNFKMKGPLLFTQQYFSDVQILPKLSVSWRVKALNQAEVLASMYISLLLLQTSSL